MDLRALMTIPRDRLGEGSRVRVRVGGDAEALAVDMARRMAEVVSEKSRLGKGACLIVPVGPVGQYAHLSRIVRDEGLDLSGTTFILMDEFLAGPRRWIEESDPLSFRGFVHRAFFDQLPSDRAPKKENRIVPDPEAPERVGEAIRDRGGVDACFGGIGLNGHVAFNEPEPEVTLSEFATRGTRTVSVAPESRAHMAVNLSCALELIPNGAVTVGMAEILGARSIRLYANRPWQRGVVRLAVHGPMSTGCPASLLQMHPDAEIIASDFVAEPAEVALR